MAQPTTDITVDPETTGQQVTEKVAETEGGVEEGAGAKSVEDGSPSSSVLAVHLVEKSAGHSSSTDAQLAAPPPRPSLVPLGSGIAQSSSTPAAPNPKRYSAVNINKKFFEKNTASGSPAGISLASPNAKVGAPTARPAVQAASSHSKLVTAKLTTGPTVLSTPTGWSRSPSVAPSPTPAANSPNSTSPLPASPSTQPPSTAAPQLSHVGKVIHPQPRAAVVQLNASKEVGGAKPVWGNIKQIAAVPIRPEIQDFPTAAEVANVASNRKQLKTEDVKVSQKPSSKQLKSEEADTFRGVHLDPNAHHWDDMEEDDDNFLNGVIEFGDGRQYKVDTQESQETAGSPELDGVQSQTDERFSLDPVSKEERFVDDFDRSWPKSKGSPPSASREFASNNALSTSPPKSHSAHSPRDPSRVLFNERSNRLEPFHQPSYRSGPGPKRSSFNEGNAVDGRGARDGHNVQVLRKGTGGEFNRSRRFSSSSSGYGPSTSDGFLGGHREGPLPSPREHSSRSPDSAFHDRKRRTSMGPPPLPRAAQKDNIRQLPPHISPDAPARRLSTFDSHIFPHVPNPPGQQPTFPGRIPPQSPATSHVSVSPSLGPHTALPPSAIDIEEARKDVMHTAAERAKARRQQEEAEREAQKERARRKAVEIEEMMKAEAEKAKQKEEEEKAKMTKEQEAVALIEEAVRTVETAKQSQPLPKTSNIDSTGEPSVPSVPRRSSIPPNSPLSVPVASQTESWRVRSNPPTPPKHIQTRLPAVTFSSSGPSAAEQVASIADAANDLEVVDFTELGKFVGIPESSEKQPEVVQESKVAASASKSSRPLASDFFDESGSNQDLTVKTNDFGAWRRQVEVSSDLEAGPLLEGSSMVKSESSDAAVTLETSTTKEPLTHSDAIHGQAVHVPAHHASQRQVLRPQFKEASMSALDDTMSRIKGVLIDMHAHDTSDEPDAQPKRTSSQTSSQPPLRHTPSRWVPPVPRVRRYSSTESREVFDVTIIERPTTPTLGVAISVHLPSISRPTEHISKKQLFGFFRPPIPARLDILTFEPPIQEMKKSWSVNDFLFRFPSTFKGKFKYRVSLPRHRGLKVLSSLAPTKPSAIGAFGRPHAADGVASWRKPMTPTSPLPEGKEFPEESSLNTTSRSPPPESTPPESAIALIPKAFEPSVKIDNPATVRPRAQPKMPEGSAVAFMRDSRIDVVESSPRPLVNFIVGSELEDSWIPTVIIPEPGVTTTSRVIHPPLTSKLEQLEPTKVLSNTLLPPTESSKEALSTLDGKDVKVEHGLITPPSHSAQSPWSRSTLTLPIKDSPSRAPDPEHLKAVWSQPSNKSDIKTVNSLEAIADDLTSLPFVLPEVKSGEGTTPSPSLPSAPSRMSIRDVTKAFQQVPTSSPASNQSNRAQISPPTTNAPVARPTPTSPGTTYPYASAPQNVRAVYAPYPSPMMTHSPGPMVYGVPMPSGTIPNRVPINGHNSLYSHPMWMSTSQPPGNVIRSPYVSPMMGYPSSGYAPQPTHVAPNLMAPPAPQTQNAGRGRGMPVVSPVLSPAHPYGGSLVLHPQNSYMPIPTDRGQPPRDNGHLPPQHPHAAQHPHLPSTHAPFNPNQTSPFSRTW